MSTRETRIPTTVPDITTDQLAGDSPERDTTGSRSSDDTVELVTGPSLADDLLEANETVGEGGGMAPGGVEPSDPEPVEDDEYYEPLDQKRSRVTTGLAVVLIFALGLLTGVLVGRLLTPEPAARIVYVLNDAATATPVISTDETSTPAPSAGR